MAGYSSINNLINPIEMPLQSYCKQVLKSKIFKGSYNERRYIDTVKGYRDMVVLNPSETELKTLLINVSQRLTHCYKNPSFWVGITSKQLENTSSNNLIIWTELEELAFGHYWFSIKTVRFRDNEVFVKLKPLRLVQKSDDKNEMNPDLLETKNVNFEDFYNLILSWGNSIKETFFQFMSEGLTKENTKAAIKFFSLLVLSLITASFHGIRYVGIFTIHFLIEFSRFISVSTPIILSLIDVFNKIVGGFYILIAMMWNDSINLLFGKKPDIHRPRNAITNKEHKFQRLEYTSNFQR